MDIWTGDACQFTPRTCPDNNECVTYACNPATGSCDENFRQCNDASACTADTCNPATGCVYTTIPCDDSNACTLDSCSAQTGCVFTNISSSCTSSDICLNPVCSPTTGCGLEPKGLEEIAVICNDNNACTTDTCANNSCVYTAITCPGPTPPNICQKGTCNPATGCAIENKTSGEIATLCNDNNACTTDTCASNDCINTVSVNCPANTPCNTFQCNPATGLCDSFPVVCDDMDICTTDTCDSIDGCTFTLKNANEVAAMCDDGNVCTTETCMGNACIYSPVTCSPPADICAKATCLPSTGCVTEPKNASEIAALCNDNNACTTDTCSGNACVYTPITCPAPNDICLESFCSPVSGCGVKQKSAAALAILCNDSNLCTNDTCSNNTCIYTPSITCPTDSPCVAFACNPGTGGCDASPVVCDDQDACTTDVCDNDLGCVYTAIFCSDNNACTTDSCNPNTGCIYTNSSSSCTSSDICMKPVCSPTMGCGTEPKNASEIAALCDDNNVCTDDTCSGGTCVYSPIPCPPSNDICLRSFCDARTGCATEPKSAAELAAVCNDTNACTRDTCTNNACIYLDVICPDPNDICFKASCNPVTGCGSEPKTASEIAVLCNDTDKCTVDSCSGSKCVNTPIVCNDGIISTLDACDAATGACTFTPAPFVCPATKTGKVGQFYSGNVTSTDPFKPVLSMTLESTLLIAMGFDTAVNQIFGTPNKAGFYRYVLDIAPWKINCSLAVDVAPATVPAGETVLVTGDTFVEETAVAGVLQVDGNLTVGGQGGLTLLAGSALNVTGNIDVNTTIFFAQGAKIVINGVLQLGSAAQLSIALGGNVVFIRRRFGGVMRATATVAVTVAEYTAAEGTLTQLPTVTYPDPCVAVGPPQVTVGATAMTVLFSLDNSACGSSDVTEQGSTTPGSSSKLSSAAIAGIAVGVVVLVGVIVAAIVGVLLYRRREQRIMKEISFKMRPLDSRNSGI